MSVLKRSRIGLSLTEMSLACRKSKEEGSFDYIQIISVNVTELSILFT